MKLASLNLGLPREVVWHGHPVITGIFKQPVAGRVVLRKLNLDGDRQAVVRRPVWSRSVTSSAARAGCWV